MPLGGRQGSVGRGGEEVTMGEAQLLFSDRDWPFRGLHEVSDPLDEALMAAGVGEVVGGGIGGGLTRIDLDLSDPAAALPVLQLVLGRLGAPASTQLRTAQGTRPLFGDDAPS
jgi:hypothetical protein